LKTLSYPFSDQAKEYLSEQIPKGAVGTFPTETFYGLGGDALQESVVRRVFALKNRSPEKALLVLVNNHWLHELVKVPQEAEAILEQFWPGALTVVLPVQKQVPQWLRGPNESLAVRCSPHPAVQAMIELANCPLIGTSANQSGELPCVTLGEVKQQFGDLQPDFGVDAGPTPGGKPSTLLNACVRPFEILREGAVPTSALQDFLV
jgi:L-threonylcarbamoyladenylate synthase